MHIQVRGMMKGPFLDNSKWLFHKTQSVQSRQNGLMHDT
jgi:hypothetical protein